MSQLCRAINFVPACSYSSMVHELHFSALLAVVKVKSLVTPLHSST